MKTIIKFIYIVFASSLVLTACSPDDDHSLGTYNISADQISFEVTPGSNEWTYNYAVSFSDDLATVYSFEVVFGDGISTKNPAGSHEYLVEAGTYTAQCLVYTPDGNMIVKEIPVTINNDNPDRVIENPNNLWNNVSFTNTFYYAPAWAQIANPALTVEGTVYTLTFPTATTDQWQNQVAFVTTAVATSAAEHYDFAVTLNASNAINGVTVKFCHADGDAPILVDSRVDLPAGETVVFEQTDLPGVDITKGKLIFDFGGNPANTTVVIRNVTLLVHTAE